MSDKLQGGVKAGSTDVTLPVVLRSTTNNTEVTGKVYTDATLSYQRTGAARTAITAATQTVTGAHSDGGFVEIDATNQPGLYRLDVPDAAFATGVDWVVITVKVSGAYVWHQLFELTTNVVQSQDHTSAISTIDIEVGVIDGIVDDILVDTGTTIPAQITAQNDLSATEVENAVWDATASSHLSANSTGKSLQQAKEAVSLETGTAQGGAAGSITLAAGANANNNFYNHTMVVITGGTGVGQVRSIQSYAGSSKVATVTPNWVVNPSSDSEYDIIAMAETHAYEVHEPVTTTSDSKIDTIDGIVDAILLDTNELQTDWTNGGRLDTILDTAAGGVGGTGSETITKDYGSSNALQVQDSGGDPLYCLILAYLKTDYDAGNVASAYIKGRTTQYADGSWSNPMMLNVNTYTLVVFKDGYQTATQEVTVT